MKKLALLITALIVTLLIGSRISHVKTRLPLTPLQGEMCVEPAIPMCYD